MLFALGVQAQFVRLSEWASALFFSFLLIEFIFLHLNTPNLFSRFSPPPPVAVYPQTASLMSAEICGVT